MNGLMIFSSKINSMQRAPYSPHPMMVDFLKLKRFGSLVDDEMDQQVFIMDLSFNPEITDELMVIYFDLNKEIFRITHES